jgi:hypothetical protein
MPQELYRCQAKAKRASAAALLVDIDGKDYWIPQSQIHEDSEVWKAGDEGELVIPEWLAIKEEMV